MSICDGNSLRLIDGRPRRDPISVAFFQGPSCLRWVGQHIVKLALRERRHFLERIVSHSEKAMGHQRDRRERERQVGQHPETACSCERAASAPLADAVPHNRFTQRTTALRLHMVSYPPPGWRRPSPSLAHLDGNARNRAVQFPIGQFVAAEVRYLE